MSCQRPAVPRTRPPILGWYRLLGPTTTTAHLARRACNTRAQELFTNARGGYDSVLLRVRGRQAHREHDRGCSSLATNRLAAHAQAHVRDDVHRATRDLHKVSLWLTADSVCELLLLACPIAPLLVRQHATLNAANEFTDKPACEAVLVFVAAPCCQFNRGRDKAVVQTSPS